VVASLIRRISFENGEYIGKPILGEMRLYSSVTRRFSDRVLVCLKPPRDSQACQLLGAVAHHAEARTTDLQVGRAECHLIHQNSSLHVKSGV